MIRRPPRSPLFPHTPLFFFFFNDTATTEIYTLSLHDALPISRAERDHLSLARRLLAARGLRRDAGRLAQEAEQRRLVLRPLDVRALDAEDGLVGLEDRALVHRRHVDRLALEQRRDLFDAGEDAPLPVLGKALEVHLGLDALAIVSMLQDLNGAGEVDVGDFAALDVGVSGGVERTLRSVRHSFFGARIAPKLAKSVSEAVGQVKRCG